MSKFTLTEHHLWELCENNEIPVNKDGMVFFGLRGCLPLNPNDWTFTKEHELVYMQVNFLHPRCTLGQWLPSDGVFAVFPGSTVPQRGIYDPTRPIETHTGAVFIYPGFYEDFKKAKELPGTGMAHDAFLQSPGKPLHYLTRSKHEEFLRWVIPGEAGDSITCAWCLSVEKRFRSHGDQVVCGFPECASRKDLPSSGPWKCFCQNGYGSEQDRFDYVLLSGLDALRVALSENKLMEGVRFGSRGDRTRRVQIALKEKGYYEGEIDGWFGPRSVRALRYFQRKVFGQTGEEGICGYQTAEVLDITWP